MKGKLIVFEGGDGTGKSSQALRFRELLRSRGRDTLHIREPGSTPVGEKIRRILIEKLPDGEPDIVPETEMLLYMASRAQLFKTVINPALDLGRHVIMERSYYSTYAYQGTGSGIDPEMIITLGKLVSFGTEPYRVVLMDMEVDQSLSRVGSEKDRIECRDTGFHERVRQGYLELARRFPDLIKVVDASGSQEQVESLVHAELSDLL